MMVDWRATILPETVLRCLQRAWRMEAMFLIVKKKLNINMKLYMFWFFCRLQWLRRIWIFVEDMPIIVCFFWTWWTGVVIVNSYYVYVVQCVGNMGVFRKKCICFCPTLISFKYICLFKRVSILYGLASMVRHRMNSCARAQAMAQVIWKSGLQTPKKNHGR